MASSRKLSLADFAERIEAHVAPLLPAHSTILIGLSGGVDSVVLLHLLHRLEQSHSWKLTALHVHHGISPNSDAWAEFCTGLCKNYAIPLHIERVDIAPLRGHGIEAAARKLRHAAFSRQACDCIALAHHSDDQVETLLLQLLRGSGVRGASAMPLFVERGNSPALLRPLLHFSRKEIVGFALDQGLKWIEDESNADDSYPRNFLRHRVLPLLEQKFSAYRDTLFRSTQHFAEADELLDELARQDSAEAVREEGLEISVLRRLSRTRAKNLLRYHLHTLGAPIPQAAQLEDMLDQLCDSRADASVCVAWSNWEICRYRGRAHVLHALCEFDRNLVLPWRGETVLDWPALSAKLYFSRSRGAGISLEKLQHAPVTIRLRHGGESLRPRTNSPVRTLKNLLQEHQVPPWQRDRLPLFFCGEELVCVPGVAVAAAYQATAGETGIQLSTG